MLAFSNDYYGMIFRATQSVELFCAYSISIWTKQFREECQTNDEAKADYDYMKENLQLKKQLAELQKENDFLKKAAAFFAKEID